MSREIIVEIFWMCTIWFEVWSTVSTKQQQRNWQIDDWCMSDSEKDLIDSNPYVQDMKTECFAI